MFNKKSDKMINKCPIKGISLLLLLIVLLIPVNAEEKNYQANTSVQVPILLYHRFGSAAVDNMTVTTPVFASHLE